MILVHKPENGVECRSEVANKVLLQRHTRERERETGRKTHGEELEREVRGHIVIFLNS